MLSLYARKLIHGYCNFCGRSEESSLPSDKKLVLSPGTRLQGGAVIVGALLGQGGFGATYIARTNEDGVIALKEYLPGALVEPERYGNKLSILHGKESIFEYNMTAFQKEAELLSKLAHPNIIQVKMRFWENNTAYYGMDLLEGSDLLTFIRARKGITLRAAEAASLIEMGHLNDVADGVYGNNTVNALKAYQRAHGYAETGEVDALLYEEFYNYMNLPADDRSASGGAGGVLMADEVETPDESIHSDAWDDVPYNQLVFSTKPRKADVTEIVFRDSLDSAPANSYDVSETRNGSVLNIAANGTVYAPVDSGALFYGYINVKRIDFGGCFDPSRALDMRGMFEGCQALEEIVMPESFNTSSVVDMTHMFMDCSSLRSLVLPGDFDASSAESVNAMFQGCVSLETLVFPDSFSVVSAKDINYMFADCSSLRELTLPASFNSISAEDMVGMFSGCTQLETLNLPESFNTASVTDMRWMFMDCSSLG